MSVDADSFVGYGIVVSGSLFNYEDVENGDKIFSWSSNEDDYGLNYNYDKADEKGVCIITEPYSGRWTYIGIPFLDKDVNKTIENLKTVKARFKEVLKELLDTIPETEVALIEHICKNKPRIVHNAYYS